MLNLEKYTKKMICDDKKKSVEFHLYHWLSVLSRLRAVLAAAAAAAARHLFSLQDFFYFGAYYRIKITL